MTHKQRRFQNSENSDKMEKIKKIDEKINEKAKRFAEWYFTKEQIHTHYNRNEYQKNMPLTLDALKKQNREYKEKYQTADEYWSPRVHESLTHNLRTSGNVKYVGKNNEEVIIKADGNAELAPEDMGTYNFKGPDDWIGHFRRDVIPWLLLGNTPEDSTSVRERCKTFFILGGMEMLKKWVRHLPPPLPRV